jgi:hypothetical protein
MTDYHRWAPSWMQRDDLPCQRVPSWFEPEGWRDSSLKVRRARRECATCPARPECLLWALTETFDVVVPRYDQESGHLAVDRLEHHVRESRSILAGTTPQERKAVAHLPLQEQVRTLSERFRFHVTEGPFASMRTGEVA